MNVTVARKFYRPSLESHLLDLDVKGHVALDTSVTEMLSLKLSVTLN